MPSPTPGRLVRLATLPDAAAADVCAALLRSAGVEPRLRGESLGPYRLTVGDLAAIEVWVPEAQLEDARAVLEGAQLPGALEPSGPAEPAGGPVPVWQRWWPVVALALLALLAWSVLQRLF